MKSPDGFETLSLRPPFRPAFQLAHQGGWDEILLVAGPLVVVALLLWVANRRVSAQLEEAKSVEPPGSADQTR